MLRLHKDRYTQRVCLFPHLFTHSAQITYAFYGHKFLLVPGSPLHTSDHNLSPKHAANRGDNAIRSTDLFCFSHLRWDFVYQRPQHLLSRCAQDRRVFFWEEPIFDGAGAGHLEVLQRAETLWVIRPHVARGQDPDIEQQRLLTGFCAEWQIDRPVRWYYTPMAVAFSKHMPAAATVYDCMDELSGFLGAPAHLLDREAQLFAAADVVFTGGLRLFEAKRARHPNVHAFPSSIDAAHFAQKTLPDPVDQASIPHPRAGFYGVLDERFDLDLIAEAARLLPAIHFVMIGPIVKIDPARLPKADNIHYLGPKSYDDLPAYLAGWDVALIPFALNPSTYFISPTKTPEYLAAGKPVVSTAIFDVVRGYGEEGLVAIASDAAPFARSIQQALAPQTETWRRNVTEKLRTTSWDATWSAMWREVERVLSPSTHAASSRAARQARIPARPAGESAPRIAPLRHSSYDYLVVGAGFAGSVIAERLARGMNKRILLIDKRDHVGGNAYDYFDQAGILVHRYGPHIFHTNSGDVMEYLSNFTEWRDYEHRVLASVDGHLLPIPINLDTVNRLYGLDLDADGMQAFLAARVETPAAIRTSEDIVVSRIGRDLYAKFFQGYTRKQWGLDPSQLDSSVAGRIPIRFNRDDRYFTDTFQAMPKHGYTRMFERMLDHANIDQALGIDYREIRKIYPGIKTIFTGPVDEFFDHRFGRLPYRSLTFDHQTFDREQYQSAPVVNYPNDYEYTRVTEFKFLTGQTSSRTSVVFEYPTAEGDPYYPIPRPENAALYAKYRALAEQTDGVHFVGRLATYKYYNMDQVVAQALTTARRIAGETPLAHAASATSHAAVSSFPRAASVDRLLAQSRETALPQ